ncbi:MAC/Perforin domain protein [Theileria parva strain Muguga]|uniref:MAC/Perforin domain protein n=1 Tax=Theileria parva strain Muguga TaxID=333668 RepID=UPI001C621A17|nr:MAC/Perforin domain protein [Theileria parva strain Muguga]EAN31689.2 MAC/Perforin domain protein [Theileria parva strain Muguga]
MANSMTSEFDRGCPGLDYLGVGYDSIYANSVGSDSTLLDPGYRAPIIEFAWRKNSEGYSPTLGSLHPVGGWVRPVFSCSRSTKINEISNLEELKDSLSASTKLNGDIPENSFTGSLEYKNALMNFKSKRQKIYNKTEQCVRYQVGIPLNLKWGYTEYFNRTLSRLPILSSKVIKNCNIDNKLNLSDEECKSIKPWIKFFEVFGTHFNNQLTLGGKINQTMVFDSSTLEELKKKGIDIEAEVRTELGSGNVKLNLDMGGKKSRLDEIGQKKMSVLGGKMPNFPMDDNEFAHWAETVAENPMPIGVVSTSLKTLMHPAMHQSYDQALHQYAILNGISYEKLKMISGNSIELSKEIENGTTIVSWNRDNKIKCPRGSKVLMGISLIFGNEKLLGVSYCKSKMKECIIPTYENVEHSFHWITCSYGLQPGVEQILKMSNADDKNTEIECPNYSLIQIGLVIVTVDGIITSIRECEYGNKSCKYDLNDNETSYIWALCYSQLDNINKLQLKVLVSNNYADDKVSCSDGYKIITGSLVTLLSYQDMLQTFPKKTL